MPKPTPGRPYTIVKGDTLTHIARAAYGNGRDWRRIWKANQTVLRSGDPNLIFPGETINISGPAPEIKALETPADRDDLLGKAKDDFTVVIEGTEVPVKSGQVIRTADTAADGWTADLFAWSEDDGLRELLRPFMYRESQVYLGGKLAIDGRLYGVKHKISTQGSISSLEGWSYTADIVDSTPRPPFEAHNITLEKRARDLVDSLGIAVVYNVDDDAPFDRVTAEKTGTIFEHLVSLAKQRGILITSDEQGNLVFTRASEATSVGTITEGVPPFQEINAAFDGRLRFNTYKAFAQSPKKNSKTAVAQDPRVPLSRFTAFTADDTTGGDVQKAANWQRSKQIAKALSFTLPVPTWYAPNGTLWQPNTIVTVVSPTAYIPDGFNFLIKEVEYNFRDDGTTAVLSLVPPQAYTGEDIEEPW